MALSCQVSYNRFFKYAFYVLNVILVILTVAFFILGFVNFDKYSVIYLGGFVGGWVSCVSVFYFCFAMIGLIGTRYGIVSLLGIYVGTNTVSFAIRILTIIIFHIKKFGVFWYYYAIGAVEVITTLICISILMVALEDYQTTSRTVITTRSQNRKTAKSVEEGTTEAVLGTN
jgi:hypothetical protein